MTSCAMTLIWSLLATTQAKTQEPQTPAPSEPPTYCTLREDSPVFQQTIREANVNFVFRKGQSFPCIRNDDGTITAYFKGNDDKTPGSIKLKLNESYIGVFNKLPPAERDSSSSTATDRFQTFLTQVKEWFKNSPDENPVQHSTSTTESKSVKTEANRKQAPLPESAFDSAAKLADKVLNDKNSEWIPKDQINSCKLELPNHEELSTLRETSKAIEIFWLDIEQDCGEPIGKWLLNYIDCTQFAKELESLKGKKIDLFLDLINRHYHRLQRTMATKKIILPKYDGTPLNLNQLMAIDMLARTLFGEMRGCYVKHGVEYPLAVARVIYNRTRVLDCLTNPPKTADNDQKAKKRAKYLNLFLARFAPNYPWEQRELETMKMRLSPEDRNSLTPEQVDALLRDRNVELASKKGVAIAYQKFGVTALMPFIASAHDMNPRNITGRNFTTLSPADLNYDDVMCPKPAEKEIFNKIAAIAAMAVLRKDVFRQMTDDIQTYHYTSKIEAPSGKNARMELDRSVWVNQKQITDDNCLKIWTEVYQVDRKNSANNEALPTLAEIEKEFCPLESN